MRLPAYVTVSACLDAFRRGDYEAAAGYLDESVEIAPSPHWAPPGTVYRGVAGWWSLLELMNVRTVPVKVEVELRDLGDHVIASGATSRNAPDGSEDVREGAWLLTVGPQGITRICWYPSDEAALAAAHKGSEHELGDAFDAAPTPMVLLDDEGLIIHVNRAMADLVGLAQEEFPERRLDDYLESPRELRFGRAGMDGDHIERELVSVDGARRRVEVRVRRNYLPDRHVVVVVPQRRAAPASRRLTEREREIFELLALGLTGPEIASQLKISANTVRTHVANGMETLEAKTRAQAVAEALSRGELDFERLPHLANSHSPGGATRSR